MKTIQETLKNLELEYFSDIYSSESNLNSIQSFYLNEIKNFGIDKVYFSGEYPSVFYKKVENFSSVENLKIIAEIHKKAWNFRKVLFLYVTSDTEIRIYNCNSKPINTLKGKFYLSEIELFSYTITDDEEKLNTLFSVFSRIGVDTGAIWNIEDFAKKIDVNKRVDKALVNSLIRTRKNCRKKD